MVRDEGRKGKVREEIRRKRKTKTAVRHKRKKRKGGLVMARHENEERR